MSNLIELARQVDKAREALDRAITALRAATGLSASAPRNVRQRPAGGPQQANGTNVSQALLEAIRRSPTGLARAEMNGLGSKGAIHSALKQHKARGYIVNVDGRWVQAATEPPTAGKKKGPRS